jgi:pimeloyl-ACP methyl ester carboxylesterase
VTELQREINKLADPVPEKFAREFQVSTVFQPLPQDFMDGVVKEAMRLPAHVWREVIAELLAPEAAVELRNIKVPTLIVWGDKETVFPRSEQDLLVSTLRNAVLRVYADTGHSPHWERPTWYVKDLQEFIN